MVFFFSPNMEIKGKKRKQNKTDTLLKDIRETIVNIQVYIGYNKLRANRVNINVLCFFTFFFFYFQINILFHIYRYTVNSVYKKY